ncbi:MAG: cupin domain-containing protein [Pseudomonadota bacterium]
MKISANKLLQRIPGAVTENWPMGERFARGFKHGSMTVELYAPQGKDPQKPHDQDELYFIIEGSSLLLIEDSEFECAPGDAFFVKAGQAHHFFKFSEDFKTWVVFWGPKGGEDDLS